MPSQKTNPGRKVDATSPERLENEVELDKTLRPLRFEDFVGQVKIVENLKVFIAATKKRKKPLDHVLLTGPPGLGKTTLAYILATELGNGIRVTSGPALEKPYDLAGILNDLGAGEILFIDEIHRIPPKIEEYLYSAMEDFRVDIVIDRGPGAKIISLELKPFTLVGATTRAGLLSGPLRSRFGISNRLDYYKREDLEKVIKRSSRILQAKIKADVMPKLAERSRGTPRIANRLLKRCRDFADADERLKRYHGVITKEVAEHALKALEVDDHGLDEMDKRILLTIIEKYAGGPVGVNTVAVAVGEEPGTIEEVYEPYLIQEGFIKRTSRGREATELAYKHFSVHVGEKRQSRSAAQEELWSPK
jgi:Holliday junction DNA helicase RuvB